MVEGRHQNIRRWLFWVRSAAGRKKSQSGADRCIVHVMFLALGVGGVNERASEIAPKDSCCLFQLDDQTVSDGHATVHAGGDVHVMGGDQHGQS